MTNPLPAERAATLPPTTTAPTPPWAHTFSRHQAASIAATAVDFGLVIGLRELLGVWYVVARACGALGGAIANFTLNRQWSFRGHGSRDGQARHQALRYAAVSGASLALNTLGTWALTESLGLHYAASALIVALLVGWAFNYPLHRHFVFRNSPRNSS